MWGRRAIGTVSSSLHFPSPAAAENLRVDGFGGVWAVRVVGDFSRGFGGERRARGNSIIIFAFVLTFFCDDRMEWIFFGVGRGGLGTGKDDDVGPADRKGPRGSLLSTCSFFLARG
jgi:hypothetical protein